MPGDFGGDFSGGASEPISYSAFQGYVADYLGRSDLTNNIPFFISWFEAWANRRFRVRQQEAVSTLTTSSGSVALPTDYLSWRRMTWTGSTGVELRYKTPSGIRILFPTAQAGIPSCFS